jgi:hypothetical protein
MRWFSEEMFFPRFDPDRASVVDDQGVPAGRGGAHAFVNWRTKQQVPGRCGAHPRAMALMTSTSGSSIQANSVGPASTCAWTENSGSVDAFATTRDMDGRSCWVPGLRSPGDVCQRGVGP